MKSHWKAWVGALALCGTVAAASALPSAEKKDQYDATAATLKVISQMEVQPGDWPQWGGSYYRNNVPQGKNIPTQWDVESGKNVKWIAQLGSETYGNPVIANGKVFVGTNNAAGYLERFPPEHDLGVLLCLDEKTGEFLWQHSNEKLPTGRVHDWPQLGVCSAAFVDGSRLWYVTNRNEVSCLDVEGFRDGENDGPFKEEPNENPNEADVIWKFDMMKELQVSQHNMCSCSITGVGDVIFVSTSNGVDEAHITIPNTGAPSFVAMDRNTGKVLWTDDSPGANILHGQWSSPAYGVFDGVEQVIFAGGDGYLYSFDPKGDGQGNSKLLWKFDCNPKESLYTLGARATRNHLIATPVVYDGLVYIAVGEDPEHAEGNGHLWCIDPTKRGDVSPELVYNSKNPNKVIPHKRLQASEPDKGDFTRPNPNSAAVWHYIGNNPEKWEESMHRTMASVVIKDGILYVADSSGLFHCLDAKTGKAHWTHDMLTTTWSTPLIVDGHVYLPNDLGDVLVFKHSPEMELVETNTMGNSVFTTPVVANNVLYIASKDQLVAIAAGATNKSKPKATASTGSAD